MQHSSHISLYHTCGRHHTGACREVYDKLSPGFRGRCTAPLLIDKKTMRPVSNESSSIVRNLEQLQLPGCYEVDLYPEDLQQQIDQLNEQVSVCTLHTYMHDSDVCPSTRHEC